MAFEYLLFVIADSAAFERLLNTGSNIHIYLGLVYHGIDNRFIATPTQCTTVFEIG